MGACASKPKDLESESAPAPVEAPATPKAEAETAPQEANGGETKKEEPLLDLSEPATEAPKEVAAETPAAATVEAVKPSESSEEETAKPSSEEKKAEVVEAAKEEKKEVADAAAAKPEAK